MPELDSQHCPAAQRGGEASSGPQEGLRAFSVHPGQPIGQPDRSRDWIEQTPDRFARLCLPLMIASQAGWWVRARGEITAEWDGGLYPPNLIVSGHGASSHFGSGIVTFNIDYLFRTPPGVQLLMKGPANYPKDGVCYLEGIVETEWAVATATMNAKLTRPGKVTWAAGEPVCHVLPVRLGDQESFAVHDLRSDDHHQYSEWSKSRAQTIAQGGLPRELHYRKGTSPGGASCPVGHHYLDPARRR